jgi:hypothetical protein
MAAAWPREADAGVRPVVVEADSAGGDLGARLGRGHVPGLLDVAAAVGRPHQGSVLGAVQELPFGVRAVLAPAGAVQCRQAVRVLEQDRGRILRGGSQDAGTVVLDAGRVTDLEQGLVAFADAVVLVARAGVDGLAHVFACRDAFTQPAGRLVLAVVGPSVYSTRDIASTVGIQHVVSVPWSPRSAAVFAGAAPAGRLRTSGWGASALLAAGGELARWVDALIETHGAVATAEVGAGSQEPGGAR